MDARCVRVNCDLPGLDLAGCYDLCSVLQALLVYIDANSGNGGPLTLDLLSIDRNTPLGSAVSTSAACAPIMLYTWAIENLATGDIYGFAGAPAADASGEAAVVSGTYSLPLLDYNALGGELCSYRVTLTVTDSCARTAADIELTLAPSTATIRQVFTFTGSQQNVTVPQCVTRMLVKAWGGGGHSQSFSLAYGGGVGGYTEAVIPVMPGDLLTVVVGEGGKLVTAWPFAGTVNSGCGGGLSGVFTDHAVLTGTQQFRAVVVAGGGGGADSAGTAICRGGNGNDPLYSGGEVSMQGVSDNLIAFPANTWNGGGGSGYNGGGPHNRGSILGNASSLPYGGNGGSAFVHPTALSSSILATSDGLYTVPNNTDVDYQVGIGTGGVGNLSNARGGHGLVVIYWMT